MTGNFTMAKRGLAAAAVVAIMGAAATATLPRQAAAAAALPRSAVPALPRSAVPAAAALPLQAVPAAAIAGGLSGVACTSASACVAVGGRSATSQGPGGTLAEKWNGTKWSAVTSPNPTGSDGARLYAAACTSAKDCLAVGDYFTASHTTLPMAEKWNGTKWSLVTVPAPAGASDAYLEAIACTSAASCWASGGNSDDTLVESWNGTAWAIGTSPTPNPGKPNVLSGMACPSASECWAVGDTFPGTYSGSLTEKWNGTKWAVVATPSSTSGQLVGDACAGTSACLAAGIGNSLFAIAQRWNGTKWSAAAPVKPGGATDSQLNGVSCATAKACESVGNYLSASSTTLTLGEKWNGTKWSLQTMPGVSGATYASLSGISCTSASNCWAAGESISSSSVTSPLLENWNGSAWTVS
jgi:hypothetical protein